MTYKKPSSVKIHTTAMQSTPYDSLTSRSMEVRDHPSLQVAQALLPVPTKTPSSRIRHPRPELASPLRALCALFTLSCEGCVKSLLFLSLPRMPEQNHIPFHLQLQSVFS
jgi:hypothetical protein